MSPAAQAPGGTYPVGLGTRYAHELDRPWQRDKERLPLRFRLWVFVENVPARRFYERRGLRLVEKTDGSRNEERTPDALYEWRPADP